MKKSGISSLELNTISSGESRAPETLTLALFARDPARVAQPFVNRAAARFARARARENAARADRRRERSTMVNSAEKNAGRARGLKRDRAARKHREYGGSGRRR